FETPTGHEDAATPSQHEMFIYVLAGAMQADTAGERKNVASGDIVYVPKGERYRLSVQSPFVRYAVVRSTAYLEHRIDSMTPAEAEQARLNVKAN
ncbi:MAG: cupin domain-containing protein, partial [Burkholderiales bacterium]